MTTHNNTPARSVPLRTAALLTACAALCTMLTACTASSTTTGTANSTTTGTANSTTTGTASSATSAAAEPVSTTQVAAPAPTATAPNPNGIPQEISTQPDPDAQTMSKPNPLPVGADAPAFSYRTADGKTHTTADLRGKPFVVYFYPKDMTPGCTTQACGFRDSYAEYEQAGIAVIGVSADSEESHGKFRAKHELPFGLTSDPEREVIEAYGVWGPKLFMGKSFLGIHRISFLVGPDGKIAKVYPKVKVADHAQTVLADARELGFVK